MKKSTINTTTFSPWGTYLPARQGCPKDRGVKKQLLLSIIAFSLSIFAFAQEYGWTDISANFRAVAGDDAQLQDISCINDNECWVASKDISKIFHTTDGGNTWEAQHIATPCLSVEMQDELNGYAGNLGIYRTTDGGNTWTFIGYVPYPPQDIEFPPDSSTAFACGWIASAYQFSEDNITIMNMDATASFTALSFPENADKGWMSGVHTIRVYENNEWTIDYETFPYVDSYNDIDMVDSLHGWAVGEDGVIIHTSDGIHWEKQLNPDEYGRRLNTCDFIDENQGWASGATGVFLSTIDGGTNWILDSEGLTPVYYYEIQFTSAINGYAVGNNSTIMKYTTISGIEDHNESDFNVKIYPIPAGNEFRIWSLEFRVSQATLEILDLNGRKLLEKQIPKGTEEVTVDVRKLNSNLYFCRIQTENRSVTKKLIIQR